MTSLWDVLWLTASVVTLLNLRWRVMFRGHVNPFYPWGALTDVFVSNGDFSGGNMRRHRILDRLTPALWVSLRFCADLQHFGPIIWGVFDLPIVLICASVKLNLQGEISPPRCYSSRGCCGLPVILSLIEPFFFCCWFLASLGLDGLDSGESSAKPLIWITSLSQWGR